MTFLAFVITMAIVVMLSVGIAALVIGIADRREKKRKKAHPELFQWFEECDEKALEIIQYKAKKITPHKTRIDYILANLQYDPAEIVEERQKELEVLRTAIYEAQPEWKRLNAEVEELRTKIRQYVEDNNLKWAKDWGW